MLRSCAAAIVLGFACPLAFAFGEPDPTFTPTALPGWECDNYKIATLADESVFLWGTYSSSLTEGAVIKFLANGTPDPSWGTNSVAPIADRYSEKLMIPTADSGLYVIGTQVSSLGPQVTRLRRDGSIDTAWAWRDDQDFDGVLSAVSTVGGGLAVLGLRDFSNITPKVVLESFGSDGAPTGTWNLGPLYAAIVYAWSIDSSGSAEIATYTTDSTGRPVPLLQRYSATSTSEVLSPQRLLPHEGVAAWMSASVGVDAAGGVVFFRVNPDNSMSLVRHNPDGSLDGSFGAGAIPMMTFTVPSSPSVKSIALWRTPDGTWTSLTQIDQYGGGFSLAPLLHQGTHALRFLADGTPDPSFTQFAMIQNNYQYARLDSGKLVRSDFSANGCTLARLLTDNVRVEGTIIEYYHPVLNHYFMTLDGFEAGLLDDNVSTMGWVRTGRALGAWRPVGLAGTTPVCRFYGDPVAGPNSHFYSSKDYECQLLKQIGAATPLGQAAWRFEGNVFSTTDATNAQCPSNLTPVYRAFSGPAAPASDPHHRYTTDESIYAQLLAAGWLGEGVQFCVTPRSSRITAN